MTRTLYLLTDYKNIFGSRYDAKPYRSGLDKEFLAKEFEKYNIHVRFIQFSEVDFSEDWTNEIVLYTSSEDHEYHYKSFIEDIVYGLEQKGAIVIPGYAFLRANNNKVFMEIMRKTFLQDECGNDSLLFGTLEEAQSALKMNKISFPTVLKTAGGACSKGVRKADSAIELQNQIRQMCATKDFTFDIRDTIRQFRHKGYIRESAYRHKFITQSLIPRLQNDWKLLIFGNRIFCLKRQVRKSDFRASGSNNDYKAGSEAGMTPEMLDFAYEVFRKLNIPMLSLDYAQDGRRHYMIEFQAVYFGSGTFIMSKDYYCRENGTWILKDKKESYEALFAWSIHEFLIKNKLI